MSETTELFAGLSGSGLSTGSMPLLVSINSAPLIRGSSNMIAVITYFVFRLSHRGPRITASEC
ncbi:Protein of unknown function [Pyronema omphalodes CBS 100304]|uniref:Uncharacterized protein n=1 Tax=Pyronema omphalodes (strain CBS 100304) TaxID=1076935 RepID=U4LA48_PYROM|nr:Protein of unknown function [Pyronema omphalodes CBS 100304]